MTFRLLSLSPLLLAILVLIACGAPGLRADRKLRGHEDRIRALGFDSSSNRILTGGDDGKLIVWDLESGESREFNGHDDDVKAISFFPSGDRAASAGEDGKVIVWDLNSGAISLDLNISDLKINDVKITADGGTILAASDEGLIHLIDTESGKEVRSILAQEGDLDAIAVMHNQPWVVSGGGEAPVRVWNFETGEVVREYPVEPDLRSVAVSPDDRLLALGMKSGAIQILDMEGTSVRTIEAHEENVDALSFSRTGEYLLSAARDGAMRMYRVADWSEAAQLRPANEDLYAVDISPDGRWIAAGGKERVVLLYDLSEAAQN